jgi:thymidylate synthase
MTNRFYDLNSATAYFANELIKRPGVDSTNTINQERYKNKLGGELIQQFFTIESPTNIVGTFENHKPQKWWMYGELLSELLNLDPPIMYKYKPEMFAQHYDLLEDGRMQYTYSNRFVEFGQLVNTFRRLKENPNSKRAVVDIFTPYDTAPDRQDAPCTTMYHFLQRDNKLNMAVMMRSWDFFGGFKTYDFALSSFIQQSFCSWLGMKPGDLSFYVNSLHYYNRDTKNLENLVQEIKETPGKRSDSLVLDGNLGIEDFYKQLRLVKSIEEEAYFGLAESASERIKSLTPELFKDMARTYITKNTKMKK